MSSPANPPLSGQVIPSSAAILTSLVRVVVPLVVGAVVTALIKVGLSIPSELITSIVTILVTGLYYAAVRFLEVHVAPSFGWLLGLAKAPAYSAAPAPAAAVGEHEAT